MNGRIEVYYTLLDPLSHIGSSIGPDSYLSTQRVLDQNGSPIDVFVYSGNAFRGMWRDAGARYMLNRVGNNTNLKVPLEIFYLMFSGGSIGGDQSIDIDQARKIREAVPHLSIFGGGVGNMLLPGKICVGEGLPVCRELSHFIPSDCPGNREISWRQMTCDISYSRTDDAKNENLRTYLDVPQDIKLIDTKIRLSGDPQKETKEKKGKPQQMRYTLEVLCRGTVLWQEIIFQDFSKIELGALVAAVHEWAKAPLIGGQSRIKMGKVKADFYLELTEDAEKDRFIEVSDGKCTLSPIANKAKTKYDDFLNRYATYLDREKNGLTQLIGGK